MTTTENDRTQEQLWDLIKDIKFAMFTTRHGNGHLHSRPMTTQNRSIDEDNALWFFMSRKGEPVTDIQTDQTVNVAYADPGDDSYVSVSGTAKVVEDMERKKALWNKAAEAWFPGGVDDPDFALVSVDIIHAGYWDVKSNKLVQLIKIATAAVTGNPPHMGEHKEVHLK